MGRPLSNDPRVFPVRVHLTLDELEQVSVAARDRNVSRSRVVREALLSSKVIR